MNDADIIKALECFATDKDFDERQCVGCAFETKGLCCENCSEGIAKASLDLINRQKAEYKDLYKKYCELAKTTNERVPVLIKEVQKSKAELRAEAIKEFAERLKTHTRKMQSSDFSGEFWDRAVLASDIDNLIKEMEGD